MDCQPLVIAVAPTGARKTKNDHPGLPVTPKEIAAAASRCLDAGASMIHLHVRDAEGRHTLDAHTYRSAIAAIRHMVGNRLVVQVTSESVGRYQLPQQISEIKEVRPEAVSISLREMVPDDQDLSLAADFFEWLVRERVVPQYILFSQEDLDMYKRLVGEGAVPPAPHWLLFVLGRYPTGFQPAPSSFLSFSTDEDISVPWAVCAFGGAEHMSASRAAVLGGHVRVGFENNLCLKNNDPADSNDQLVGQIFEVAQAVGRPVADAHALRALFGED